MNIMSNMLIPKYVIKRDGSLQEFNEVRIINAIYKALKATSSGNWNDARNLAKKVVDIVVDKYKRNDFKDKYPHVEEIQDIVEYVLMKEGFYKAAKAYILYREKRKEFRENKLQMLRVVDTVHEYLDGIDWRVKENSNAIYSFSGLMSHIANKVIAYYTLMKIYSHEIAEAHLKGYFHIHDLGYGIVPYCAGWDVKDLIIYGFGGVPNLATAKPPKHLDTLVSQMVNFLGSLQMEFAGAQSFSDIDVYMAAYIKKEKLDYKQVKQNVQRFVYGLNIASRWATQTPFTNITLNLEFCPEPLKNMHAIVGKEYGKPEILSYTYEELKEELKMINKAFLEIYLEGDANGRIFTFPIPTLNLTKEFNWDSELANLLFKVTAKFGNYYFQNYIGSDLDPYSIRSMCCRLNLDKRQLRRRGFGLFGSGEKMGSIGVVTLNLNRYGYEARGDEDRFFEILDKYLELAKMSLEIKRKIITENLRRGLIPYTKRYLHDIYPPGQELDFTNHFSTIGVIGMNEALVNLFGKDIATKEGLEFAIKVLKYIRKRLVEFQEETGNLYNLEATPAESAMYRLAMLDKKIYGSKIFTQQNDGVPYLTNSTWLPSNYTDDLAFVIKHQEKLQPLYTGGTVLHIYLGEKINEEDAKTLVKLVSKSKIPYFTVTPTFSICKIHGYFAGEHETCPVCNSETEVFSRVVGYFRPVKQWNPGKVAEWKDRKFFNYRTIFEEFLD